MKYKNIMLMTILLLAVLTIGAASATEDVDALAAVDDAGDEAVVEAPVDEMEVETSVADEDVIEVEQNSDALSYPDTNLDNIDNLTPEDFKVTFPNTEFDTDKEDPVVITYFTPEGIHQYSSDFVVYYGDGQFDYVTIQMDIADVGTYKNITWSELYQRDPGVYNISVYYSEGMRDFMGLGNATLNVSYNHEYTAADFIYIYSYVGNGEDEDWLAEIYDDEIEGLDGVVTAYANDAQIYTKTYSNSTKGGPINAKDLTGAFNGEYNVKIEYKRTDGKVFTISRNVYFDNIVGGGEPIKTTITVSPSSVSMVYNANKNLVATLKDANGKPIKDMDVYINIMGVSYPVKTDKNGQVKQSLSSLPPKTHTVTFTFKDTAPYKASSKKVTVKVSKATPTLSAPKKTFKKSVKTKKYTVTLKDNNKKALNKKTVKLTVNKKTYMGKTNSKGQVTFKITNLKKKGTFKATAKFAGDSYYKAKTVSTKITVK